MKFYGNSNELVSSRKYNNMKKHTEQKPIFRFDNNGEYETDNPDMIERLKPHFKHSASLKCKKCDFETENKGLLMAHYREMHPKEDN